MGRQKRMPSHRHVYYFPLSPKTMPASIILTYQLDHAVKATQKEILKAFNMTARNVTEQAAAINEDLQSIYQ